MGVCIFVNDSYSLSAHCNVFVHNYDIIKYIKIGFAVMSRIAVVIGEL